MSQELKKLQEENEDLKRQLQIEKQKSCYYDYSFQKWIFFKTKIIFLISLLRFFGDNASVYGSFVRKIFDFSLRFDKSFLAQSLNPSQDINIIFNNQKHHDKTKTVRDFYKTIKYLENLIIFSYFNDHQTPDFNGFKIFSVKLKVDVLDDNGKVIPRAILHFKNKHEEKILVKLIAWREKDNVDYSINSCILNKDGILVNPQTGIVSFYEYLENLVNSETTCIPLLNAYQDNAFPILTSIPRESKVVFLTKLYDFIKNRSLRAIESGFSLVGVIPAIRIEIKEECHLTSCSPPYPVLELECGHWISMMGYKGLIDKGDVECSEAIRCPMCRGDLKIKFITQRETVSRFQYLDFTRYLKKEGEQKRSFDPFLISQDSLEQL